MQKLYPSLLLVLAFCLFIPKLSLAQRCSLTTDYATFESRCAATGSIKVSPFGGSGDYKYKVAGPVVTDFTSTDSITGLAAGTYILTVTDINTGCTITVPDVFVPGNYKDPRFTLNAVDVSCDNGNNGQISLASRQFGRAPYRYSIIAPSPMGVGTTNNTGTFNNLVAGVYTIRLTDSCGGIQTRLVTINNYTWRIDSFSFVKFTCDSVRGRFIVSDSRGNISTVSGLPGFRYGIVRSPGDTVWTTNPNTTFYTGNINTFGVVVKDPCGNIKRGNATVDFRPSVGNNVNQFNVTCNGFSASLTNIRNFSNPNFCLTNNSGVLISCNSTGTFHNLPYGRYCITAKDSCSDTTIVRCFSRTAPQIWVGEDVTLFNRNCTSFSAAISGQSGLTNPLYCLKDSIGNVLACNNNGTFHNLGYARYCISITDTCRDTTIVRCFNPLRPRPSVPAVITPSYSLCPVFGIVINGDSLNSPRFCLTDTLGNVIICNNTGVFDSIPYGRYCINIYDSCYDTTIIRCVGVLEPVIRYDLKSEMSNRTCSSFTAVFSAGMLIEEQYCLYNGNGDLVGCNTMGIFDNLPYGNYCLKTTNRCPDTTFTYCFTAIPPLPSVDNSVRINNRTCNTFTASITGLVNITNPNYCLLDSVGNRISCNSTGVFSNVPFGRYCITTTDGCYDTTINRCFTVRPNPIRVTVSARRSCAMGFTRFTVSSSGAINPINIKIYRSNGSLFFNRSYNSTPVTIDSIPGTVGSQRHRVVLTDACGSRDSVNVIAVASTFSKNARAISLCPSSSWPNGSGTIRTVASSNSGSITVRIIKRNNVTLSPMLSPNLVTGSTFNFNNLQPATYIVRYVTNDGCNNFFYDTLTIKPYQFPNLERSNAYQCDQNGFSLGAVVNDGIGPFRYEIIGSTPASPSIITAPQSSPIFNVNNGSSYSLIRLRAVDACGNASLEDASILPLANNGISATFNCFQLHTTLRIDTVYNASISWFMKRTFNNNDSTFLGSNASVYIPNVLPADTGYYFCNVNINNGCIRRRYYFHLNGNCFITLPVKLEQFSGTMAGDKNVLNWLVSGLQDLREFEVQRQTANGAFETIGIVNSSGQNNSQERFSFTDSRLISQRNFYRLKIINTDGRFTYSPVIQLQKRADASSIRIYPNPATDKITIEFKKNSTLGYQLKLYNITNQLVKETTFNGNNGTVLQILRGKEIGNGVYVLRIYDKDTGQEHAEKIILK
jgi:hypothetical protein